MDLLVVILNYRTPKLVVRGLSSLEPEVQRLGSMHVVVTDNDSGDGSVDLIGKAIEEHGWGEWCTLMPLSRNGGFSWGCNAGIRPYIEGPEPPKYVMLHNPDAWIREGAVSALREFLEEHPNVGIAGSRIESPDGPRLNSCFRFPTATSELLQGTKLGVLDRLLHDKQLLYEPIDEPTEVDWVSGAAMMIRKEVFDDIGLLDEGYFLYFDDVDFCFRARRAGWPSYYVPSSVVAHLKAQATGITHEREEKRRYPDYYFDSRRRFFVKNRGKLGAALADVAFLGGYTTFRLRRVLQRKPFDEPPFFWRDSVRNSIFVKGFQL